MTEQISKPHKRLTTTLGIAIAAALSPSGKIISSAVAAGVVAVAGTGYAIHEHKPPPHQIHASIVAAGIPAYLSDIGPLPLVYTDIESEDGHEVHLLLTTGADASGSHGSAPSLWVTGGPIGAAGNPNQSFQRVGPTFGGPEPHPNAPDSPRPGFPPEDKIPKDIPPSITEKIDCRQDKNKRLKVCEAAAKDAIETESEAKETKSADEEKDKDASNPSTHPNNEAAGPDNVGNHPRFNAPGEGTGTPSAQEPQPTNVELLEKLLTEEFNGDGVIPPGDTEPKSPGKNGDTANDQAEQKQSFSDLALIPTSVPEPSLISLMFLGVAAMAWTGRRRTAKPTRV